MSTTAQRRAQSGVGQRHHTIGAVCRHLQGSFPDISISKIRYLEDQGLLAPRRTQGGYRLFSQEDVERLETILRLQRDEFLPLRVIRQELSSGGSSASRARKRRSVGIASEEPDLTLGELCEEAGITSQLARELEDFGLLAPSATAGDKRYPVADVDVARACSRLAKYGVSARHLRTFRTMADREAGLLEQIVAPALRSRNPERRQSGLEDLQALGELAQELSQLLLWRELRGSAAR
jgi:DNA-binding transcriptional MerR regulator